MVITVLIQKINFPDGNPLEINSNPGTEEILKIQKSMVLGSGYGSVVIKNGSTKGFFNDRLGNSIISDFFINEKELRFKQLYNRGSKISYVFTHRNENVWSGSYSSDEISGKSNCIITLVKKLFFEPQ